MAEDEDGAVPHAALGRRLREAAGAAPPSATDPLAVRRRTVRGRWTRRALGAGLVVVTTAVVLLRQDATGTAPTAPVRPAVPSEAVPSATASPPVVAPLASTGRLPGAGWGPDVPHLTVGGRLHSGAERWPDGASATTLTEVSTGVVVLDEATGQVVHRAWDGERTVLGATPWRGDRAGEQNPGDVASGVTLPWQGRRALLGNPEHDVVVWVVGQDGEPRSLVVVRAGTGEELARTPVPGEPGREVVLASVDDRAVYLATPAAAGMLDIPGEDVWTWPWASGEPPRDASRAGDVIADVSAGVFVTYGPGGIRFVTEDGTLLSSTRSGDSADRSYFGHQLSPDGRFWRSGMFLQVADTATGRLYALPDGQGKRAWTAADEVSSLWGDQLTVCTYPSGACSLPLTVPLDGVPELPLS